MEKYIVKSQTGEVFAGLYAPITSYESAVSYANSAVFSAQFPEITEATVVVVTNDGTKTVYNTEERV
jgi:hypothetical protein|tara:strand:- start:208 stop:408 length:201 start_codon:yes stop_codon:yes gene_type:complete